MAHVAKFTRGTCGLLARHYERYKDKEHPEEVKYKNQDIDSERTHLNYNLAPMRQQMPYLKKRLKEVHCLDRDNVNVMCDWVVTAPKELPAEHQREFFEVCYKHLEEKYGEKNVISAYVHMDENQPHMHFAFVPVVYDVKKDREKVSAKEALNRSQLKRFHPELQEVIDKWIYEKDYDFECNVLNGATEGGNKTIEELKTELMEKENDALEKENNELWNTNIELQEKHEKLGAEVSELEEKKENLSEYESRASELITQISKADETLKTLTADIENLNSQKAKTESTLKTLQKDVEAKEIYLGVLNSPDINKVSTRARENVMGKLQGKDELILERSDFNSLLRTANLFAELKKKINKMIEDAKRKIMAADKYYEDKVKEAHEEVKEIKWKSIEEVKGQIKKDQALENYQSLEKKFPEVFKQMRDSIKPEKTKTISHHEHERF